MRLTTIILLFFTCLWACKKKSYNDTHSIPKEIVLSNDSISNPPSIKVFHIIYDKNHFNTSGQLALLNKSLTTLFNTSKHVKDKENLKERLNSYKRRETAQVLAKDFENNAFTKATQIDVSFLSYQQKFSGDIKIEEWHFREENEAKSCFNTFNNYWEREIHFKSINWIWLQQKNKLFFISTIDYRTNSKPMQTIKQHLIDILKKQGEYSIIEMD